MRGLVGKIALVTGGTGLIGSAICKRLHEGGVTVLATYHRQDPSNLYIDTNNFYYLDLKYPSSIDNLRYWCDSKIRPSVLNILVNCAGCNIPRPFNRITEKEWDTVVNTNLKGTFLLTQSIIELMNSGGSIVNIGSLSGFIGGPTSTHYAASKAGLWALTQNVALFGASRGIRCNMVAPGYLESPMTTEGAKSEAVKKMIENIPLGRLGTAEEVANAVAFLASDEASYVTGTVLHVNGGVYSG